jgi:hypothetical protein
VVTGRHAEEFGTVYIDWNRLKTRVRARAGKFRGEGFGILLLTLLCIVRVADGCGGRGKGVGGRKVTKGWRDRSATRMIVEGYSRPELTVSGEECVERRWRCGRDAIGYRRGY